MNSDTLSCCRRKGFYEPCYTRHFGQSSNGHDDRCWRNSCFGRQEGVTTAQRCPVGICGRRHAVSIILSIEASTSLYGEGPLPALIAVAGVLLGVAAIFLLDEYIPHEHFISGREGPISVSLKRIWLFVIAITIHNIPEGLAVGIGFGGGDIIAGTTLAVGIGLQNAPEGLAVALALQSESYSRSYAFVAACLTGLVEPVAGMIGAAAVRLSQVLPPWGLTFAAGAMIYVISHEIIPETHRHGHQKAATFGLTIGLVLMMFLDVTFG
ncbi:ZIP family metal transporter [Hoeflea sp. TYP-13]|uniref:ZIP family metal transporter n=1 Tax=Hoeflea sp. TYP-13 TaxID=3230023 RepID=UPI0034C6078C